MFYLGPHCYPFKFLQAQDQSKRELLKEASNWSPKLSTSSDVYLLPSLHIHHIKYNGAKFEIFDECFPNQREYLGPFLV